MTSFISNVSETTTWIGYVFKTKGKQKIQIKAKFLRKEHLFESKGKLRVIKLAQGHWCCMPTH